MVLEYMLDEVRDYTKVTNNDAKLVRVLNRAKDWAFDNVYLMNADIPVTFGTVLSPAVNTQDYDIQGAVAAIVSEAVVYGIKNMWVKYSGDTDYTPIIFRDATDPVFMGRDQLTAQVTIPLYADITNFTSVRFSTALPASTSIRVDWIGHPLDFGLDTNVTLIAPPVHRAIVAYAISLLFNEMDDDRDVKWEARAKERLITSLHIINQRQFAQPRKTQPFRSSRRRRMGF